jgi:hypothetical protein
MTVTLRTSQQPPCRIGCRFGERSLIVELDGNAFAHAAPLCVRVAWRSVPHCQ